MENYAQNKSVNRTLKLFNFNYGKAVTMSSENFPLDSNSQFIIQKQRKQVLLDWLCDEKFERSLDEDEKDKMTVFILKTGNQLYIYPFKQS